MKKIVSVVLYLFLACPVIGFSAQPAADPHMTPEERAKVVKLLLDTQKEYLDSLENLTDEQWKYKPSPFKWSVGETAEHIVLTESRALLHSRKSACSKAQSRLGDQDRWQRCIHREGNAQP